MTDTTMNNTNPMLDFAARMAEWDKERKATVAANRCALHETLSSLGVAEIVAEYDAYGDSGNIESVSISPEGFEMEESLNFRLRDFLWSVVYDLHPGFENNDGGDGEIRWNVEENKIDVDHRERFTDYNSYSHEGV